MLDTDYSYTLQNGVLTISLPGTDSWADMVANLRIGRRRVYGCRVNRMDRAEALCIIRALRPQIEQAKQLRIYGHSRGGAVALQIAWEIMNATPERIFALVVTAAKPTGDRCFVKRFKHMAAYRQRGDIIPFLPPWQPNVRHSRFGKWQPFWKAHRVRNYRGRNPWSP